MAKYTPIITLILIVAGFVHAIGRETTNEATTPVAEIAFSSETIRPGNMAFTSDGRMFVTINPLTSPNVKVYEINRQGGQSKAYPNDEYVTGGNSVMKAVIGIRTDRADNLWLLDMGAKQFVVWDTHNEKLVKTIAIPEEVLTPASFLQDFIIDEKHGRVIIADMTQGDLKSAPTPAFVKKYSTKSYCDGIAVDQSQNVYFTNIEEQAFPSAAINSCKQTVYESIDKPIEEALKAEAYWLYQATSKTPTIKRFAAADVSDMQNSVENQRVFEDLAMQIQDVK